MNRRTFLKSTALTFITPTLLLKGEETLKPLQWTSFSSKSPKNKEFILIVEKNQNSVIYKIGSFEKNNIAHIGQLAFAINKNGKKEYLLLKRLNDKLIPYIYYINKNVCHWISITDILKHTKNTPFNKANINVDIVKVKQYPECFGVYVGKIIDVNDQEITITSKYFDNKLPFQKQDIERTNRYFNIKIPYLFLSNKNDITQWTKLPKLPTL